MRTPTILIVDDYEELRASLKLWLEGRGYKVLEAMDGENAVEVAIAERPDLILMDIGMPRRSGISAAYRIHKHTGLQDVPIIAITAYDSADLREDAFKAGFIQYLTKPIDTNQLETLLSDLLPNVE